jgi:hypothetical protein
LRRPRCAELGRDATPLPDVPSPPAAAAPSRRLWEIDALRGLMLVLMTLTHIPTRFADPLGQPLGFVSAAEGFVLLSGFVAGMVYTQRQRRDGDEAMREAFVQRAVKLYAVQVSLLLFVLSVVTLLGLMRQEGAVTDLVSWFLEHPLTALISGLLLIYNPPLLDILPMYVLFMLASPLLLWHGARGGWNAIVLLSAGIWLCAQFGLSESLHAVLVWLVGMPVPLRQTGAFEMVAWQFIWVLGLWMGASQGAQRPVQPAPFPRGAVVAAAMFAAVHLVWREHALRHVAARPAAPARLLRADRAGDALRPAPRATPAVDAAARTARPPIAAGVRGPCGAGDAGAGGPGRH